MAEDARDTLMMLQISGTNYVPGECTAVIVAPDDKLGTGFKGTQVTGGLINGNYFAVDDFSFDVGIKERGGADDMQAQADDTRAQVEDLADKVNKSIGFVQQRIQDFEGRLRQLGGGGGPSGGGDGIGKIKPDGRGRSPEFSRFMIEGRSFLRKEKNAYPSDLEPVSITKRMDMSSPVLFDYCRKSFKFASATLLKRKAIGSTRPYGFLRIDFTDVMLIELNWDDDEVTKETFKFVCRKAVVTYAKETPSQDKSNRGAAVLEQMPAVEWNVLTTGS